jgi:hypothetical protein
MKNYLNVQFIQISRNKAKPKARENLDWAHNAMQWMLCDMAIFCAISGRARPFPTRTFVVEIALLHDLRDQMSYSQEDVNSCSLVLRFSVAG